MSIADSPLVFPVLFLSLSPSLWQQLPVESYPTVLQQSLETDVFSNILTLLREHYVGYEVGGWSVMCEGEQAGVRKGEGRD